MRENKYLLQHPCQIIVISPFVHGKPYGDATAVLIIAVGVYVCLILSFGQLIFDLLRLLPTIYPKHVRPDCLSNLSRFYFSFYFSFCVLFPLRFGQERMILILFGT